MFESVINYITPEMSRSDIEKILEKRKEEFRADINKLIDCIKDGKRKDEVINRIKCESNNPFFCQIVEEIVSSGVLPFEETTFLRALDLLNFNSLCEYLFFNTVLQTEQKAVVLEKTQIDNNMLSIVVKLLNTATEWIVVRKYTFNLFKSELYRMFRLDEKRAEYLWSLYNEHRAELNMMMLLDNRIICKAIMDDVKKLIDIFSELINDKEYDSDE